MSRDDLRPLSAEPIDLVAIDLDGTLLRSDSTVSDANVEAIRAAIAAGVIVVLASARPPRGCREVCERLNLQTLQINHNGALIYDPAARQAVRHHRLSGPLAAQIIQIARRVYPEVAVGVERLDHFYVDRDAARLAAEPSLAMAQDQAGRFAAELTEPVTKVVFAGDPQGLGGIQFELLRLGKGKLALAYTHLRLLSVVHPQASKASALARVAEHYCVPRQRVMAIGDGPNDLDMLQWSGLGVAVANAWNDVRGAAHFVVASNDQDGVAEAIRQYVLRHR